MTAPFPHNKIQAFHTNSMALVVSGFFPPELLKQYLHVAVQLHTSNNILCASKSLRREGRRVGGHACSAGDDGPHLVVLGAVHHVHLPAREAWRHAGMLSVGRRRMKCRDDTRTIKLLTVG